MQALDRETANELRLRSVFQKAGTVVWEANLDYTEPLRDSLLETLCPDEIARAERYTDEKIAQRFIARRGILRYILATYCGVRPQQLRFRVGAQGKPELEVSQRFPSVRFNVSSSGNIALIAVSKTQDIGVDIEQIRRDISLAYLVEDVCTLTEQQILSELPMDRRYEEFFAMWSRKEAYAKAYGKGLTLPFNELLVASTGEYGTAPVHVPRTGKCGKSTGIYHIDAGERFRAAVAICSE